MGAGERVGAGESGPLTFPVPGNELGFYFGRW